MRTTICIFSAIASVAAADRVLEYTFDAQINHGSGDVYYVRTDVGCGQDIQFVSDGGDDFGRVGLNGADWYYGPYVDFELDDQEPLDISVDGSTLMLNARYYQDPSNNNPYADAPIFMRLYSRDDAGTLTGWRDYGIIYATQLGDFPYPVWTELAVDLNDPAAVDTNNGAETFDPTNIRSMRFYGTDWEGNGDDFIDFDNMVITLVEGGCAGDWNGDTVLDIFDVLDYLADFDAEEEAADITMDGEFDIFDVLGFLEAFDAGC